jgi:hypothetical protein
LDAPAAIENVLALQPRLTQIEPGFAFRCGSDERPQIHHAAAQGIVEWNIMQRRPHQPDAAPPGRLIQHIDSESFDRSIRTDQVIGWGLIHAHADEDRVLRFSRNGEPYRDNRRHSQQACGDSFDASQAQEY